MRSDNITFADLTKVYNKIYSNYYCSIYQSTISRECKKLIEIFDEEFVEFLKEKNKLKENEFLEDSITPIKKGKTRFGYNTYCLMLVSLIDKSGLKENIIATIKKNRNHIQEYKYVDLHYKIIELTPKIIEISLEKNEKDTKMRFEEDIKSGIDMSIKIYDLLDMYYRERFKNDIEELLIKIDFMSYESKSNLINVLKKEIEKEMHRTEKRKINKNNEGEVIQKKLDEIENNIAMKSMSRKEMKEIEDEGGAFFANLARREFEYPDMNDLNEKAFKEIFNEKEAIDIEDSNKKIVENLINNLNNKSFKKLDKEVDLNFEKGKDDWLIKFNDGVSAEGLFNDVFGNINNMGNI